MFGVYGMHNACGHALKSLILFLISYTMFIPYGFQNAKKSQISATADAFGHVAIGGKV